MESDKALETTRLLKKLLSKEYNTRKNKMPIRTINHEPSRRCSMACVLFLIMLFYSVKKNRT